MDGTARQWPDRQVHAVGTPRDRRHVAAHCHARGVVRVHPQGHLRWHELLEPDGRVVNRLGVRGAAGVLEADAVDLHVALEQPPPDVDVELRRVNGLRLERQAHERNRRLVVHPGVDDGLAGVHQIADVVHVIEVAIPGGAAGLHQLRLEPEGLG